MELWGHPWWRRALAIVHTCMYDAWAAYDQKATGTQLGGSLRTLPAMRTHADKSEAISFAAYRAAVDLFPWDKATVFDPLMEKLGYDEDDTSTDTETPAGIGNVACAAVLAFRHTDGSNQLGDLTPSGIPYADYTGYQPQNLPSTVPVSDLSTVRDPNRWQPLKRMFRLGHQATPAKVQRMPAFPHLSENNVRKGFLDDAQYRTLVDGAELWFRGLVECGRTYGWRVSELLNLHVEQVDLVQRVIRLEPGTTKNTDGREVFMTDAVHALLGACVIGKQGRDAVFTRSNGKPVRSFRGTWEKECTRAGVGQLVWRSLLTTEPKRSRLRQVWV